MKKLLLILSLAVYSIAAQLNTGEKIPTFSINDQFEKAQMIPTTTKTIIVAGSKDASDVIKEYLLSLEGDSLTKNDAVYIADISGMPSLITKFFALPKMKKYPFKILLLDETNNTKFLMQEDKITIYEVENQLVKDVKYITTKEELAAYVK